MSKHPSPTAVRWGVALGKVNGVARIGELAAEAEGLGYDDVWVSNERFYRDMYVGLTVATLRTSRVRLGSFCIDPYSAHPALSAVTGATLDELSGGRAIIGIGAGGTGFPAMGLGRARPATAIREAILVMKALLRGETVTFEGEVIQCRGARLSVAPRPALPVLVATQGERVLAVAGEMADEVMISTFASPGAFDLALRHVAAGAARAGRAPGSVPIVARIDAALGDDLAACRAAVKPILALGLLVTWPKWEWVEAEGLVVPPALAEVIHTNDYQKVVAAAPMLPDAFADRYAWVGPPDRVAEQVAALVRLGVTGVTILPHAPPDRPGDVWPTARAFVREVKPRVERLLQQA
jgi:5,10-methylenetetrahydromethanopterin reductase